MDSNNYIDDILYANLKNSMQFYLTCPDEQISYALRSQLTAEFGKGFSYANLKNFKQFYLTCPNEQLATHCVANLTEQLKEEERLNKVIAEKLNKIKIPNR